MSEIFLIVVAKKVSSYKLLFTEATFDSSGTYLWDDVLYPSTCAVLEQKLIENNKTEKKLVQTECFSVCKNYFLERYFIVHIV